jgi:DNA-binding transcriptional MerR regulator
MKRGGSASELLIGEVAVRAGVSVDTIRYYERRRLLPPAPRTAGGYRVFSPDTVARVRFIKQAQSVGFSLKEIAALLNANPPNGVSECQRMRELLLAKLEEVEARLSELRQFRRTLRHYLAECDRELRRHGATAECPVVDEIARPKRLRREERRR